MANILFILGAGASKSSGAPLMNEFIDVARDLYALGQVSTSADRYQNIFDTISALQAVHSKSNLDIRNIESIFTALELGRIIEKLPGVELADIDSRIADLKFVIYHTIEQSMEFPIVDGVLSAPSGYIHLADTVQHLMAGGKVKNKVSFITFNYDIALDHALISRSIPIDYGLGTDGIADNVIPVLKLHGSINWALMSRSVRCDDPFIVALDILRFAQEIYRNHNRNATSLKLPMGTYLKQSASYLQDFLVSEDPVIVPPSWNKTFYFRDLARVWSNAAHILSSAEAIYVLGYSLPQTDNFFRHLYSLGSVGKSIVRQFTVYNPDVTGEVDMRFRSLLGPQTESRYRYEKLTFEQAISTIRSLYSA